MGRIYKGQSALRIALKTFCDLEGIECAAIRYRKPDGSSGEFPAAVSDAAQGVISYECADGDIDAGGWWAFWAFIAFDDGRSAAGQAAKVYVWLEGQ